MIDETSLGWTRYTPLIYLSFNVMLFVETMLYFVLNICYEVSSNLYTLRLIPMFPPSVGV
ncbi:hypothetical protein HanRHA438_Chr16g0767261 [Helianthus annuus]|nr:hypothetical protein HanRHA438_Chr16g0767261 [Helianthus annuus]